MFIGLYFQHGRSLHEGVAVPMALGVSGFIIEPERGTVLVPAGWSPNGFPRQLTDGERGVEPARDLWP
jgi:hypothetical protein